MAESKVETLLCTIPFSEPKEITASIKKKFPNLRIIFIETKLTVNWVEEKNTIHPGKVFNRI